MAAASHNSFLVSAVREARVLQRQASVIGVYGLGGHAEAAVVEHEAIYRAIRGGDPDAAAEATSAHLDNSGGGGGGTGGKLWGGGAAARPPGCGSLPFGRSRSS